MTSGTPSAERPEAASESAKPNGASKPAAPAADGAKPIDGASPLADAAAADGAKPIDGASPLADAAAADGAKPIDGASPLADAAAADCVKPIDGASAPAAPLGGAKASSPAISSSASSASASPTTLSPRTGLAILMALAAAVIALGNLLAKNALNDLPAEEAPVTERAPNVIALGRNPLGTLPPSDHHPVVILTGNSHTYGLPGLKRGDPLRPDPGHTLIDELAKDAQTSPDVLFYRASNPNLLPFEMLTRVSYMLHAGVRPNVVIAGWTWTNFARGRDVRAQIHAVYRDPAFVADLRRRLEAVSAHPDVLAAIDDEVRRIDFEAKDDRLRSDADRADLVITDWLKDQVTIMGHSADLRARIYRGVVMSFQDFFAEREGAQQTYDVIPADLAFNTRTMIALLALLRAEGVTVLAYLAPERSDLAPLTDAGEEERAFTELIERARALGASVVDARHVVPGEYWGYAGDFPDRAHFTEPGHRLLARYLSDQAAALGIWSALSPVPAPAAKDEEAPK